VELVELCCPSEELSSLAQLIWTCSVKRFRILKRLDKVPPAPTSLRSWYPLRSSSSHAPVLFTTG